MEPDKYQQAWQAHTSQTRVTVDADVLLTIVQRNRQEFRSAISWGRLGEIGILLLMLPVWICMGVAMASPWTWYLMVPALLWSIGFTLVVRARHKPAPNDPGEPLLSCVKESLAAVEHLIWLQRNDFWWKQLPTAIPMLVFFAHIAWLSSTGWLGALGFFATLSVFVLAVYSSVYYLNQRVVRTRYEPRRQELLALLASLRDETTSEVSGEYPILMRAERVKCSPRRMFVAGLCAAAILLIGVPGILFVAYSLDQMIARGFDQGYPQRSPFAAVRWQQSQPEVKIGDEWFKLLALDGIATEDIVAFSQSTYEDMWRKRFEEDLVELLTRMGYPPRDTVTLVVQSLTSAETRTLEDVPMTRANRQAIRDAAQARERSEHAQGMR